MFQRKVYKDEVLYPLMHSLPMTSVTNNHSISATKVAEIERYLAITQVIGSERVELYGVLVV